MNPLTNSNVPKKFEWSFWIGNRLLTQGFGNCEEQARDSAIRGMNLLDPTNVGFMKYATAIPHQDKTDQVKFARNRLHS